MLCTLCVIIRSRQTGFKRVRCLNRESKFLKSPVDTMKVYFKKSAKKKKEKKTNAHLHGASVRSNRSETVRRADTSRSAVARGAFCPVSSRLWDLGERASEERDPVTSSI